MSREIPKTNIKINNKLREFNMKLNDNSKKITTRTKTDIYCMTHDKIIISTYYNLKRINDRGNDVHNLCNSDTSTSNSRIEWNINNIDDVKNIIENNNIKITLLSDKIEIIKFGARNRKKISFLCNICNTQNNVDLDNFKRSIREERKTMCSNKKCKSIERLKKFKCFLDEINYKLLDDNKLKYLSKYQMKNSLQFKCPKGHIFKRSPISMGFKNHKNIYIRCLKCNDRI